MPILVLSVSGLQTLRQHRSESIAINPTRISPERLSRKLAV